MVRGKGAIFLSLYKHYQVKGDRIDVEGRNSMKMLASS